MVVAHAELVDLAEQLVLGPAREDVGHAGLDAHADEREASCVPPPRLLRELLVAEHDAGELVRPVGVRRRQAHRHVEVDGAAREGALEDRHHEARVDGVQHVRDGVLADQGRDRVGARRVDRGAEEARVAQRVHQRLRAGRVVVGDDEQLEERASHSDADGCGAHASRADDQDPGRCNRCRVGAAGCRGGRFRGHASPPSMERV
jgi:hypothetical protein